MTAPAAQTQEPSMEDILASIRRILSDDEVAAEEKAEEVAPQDPNEGLNMADFGIEEEPEEEAPQDPNEGLNMADFGIEEEPEEEVFEPAPAPVVAPAPRPAPAPKPAPAPRPDPIYKSMDEVMELTDDMIVDGALLAPQIAQQSACAISELARAIAADRNVLVGGPGVTLEELAVGMLKPMIKAWLDANLPFVVEKIVRKEIERVVEKAKY